MKIKFPTYDGDSVMRCQSVAFVPESPARAAVAPAISLLEAAGKPTFAGPYLDLQEIEQRARRNRAEAVAGLFARLLAWIARQAESARDRDLERYLSSATDLADLERRMRLWERRSRSGFSAY